MESKAAFLRILRSIDGKGYGAYKEIRDTYDFGPFALHIEHVQADPFAPPSRIRIEVPRSFTSFPDDLLANAITIRGTEDFLIRRVDQLIREKRAKSKGKAFAEIRIERPGQTVLTRSAMTLNRDGGVEARLTVELPAKGRRIFAKAAERIFCEDLIYLVDQALNWRNISQEQLKKHINLLEEQDAIRRQLKEKKLVAFIANGSLLARESGRSDLPMKENAVPFHSPPSLEVEMELPNGCKVKGMGIPEGVTLIVGGGYHGKSTLLQAIERGVYDHIGGDGREYCITDRTAVKVRAEDGRPVSRVDITTFINHLPQGRSTKRFSTQDASGSTSQAAGIIEAVEMGARCLLMDEDTCATNFMIRDARMQELITKEQEPITPFLDRVREFYEVAGVSTILVLGGAGDYLDVADRVIAMHEYRPSDVTAQAKEIATRLPTRRKREKIEPYMPSQPRYPLPEGLSAFKGEREKAEAKGLATILYGKEIIDLSGVSQLVEESQTRAIAHAIRYAVNRYIDGTLTLQEVIARVMRDLEKEGFQVISPFANSVPGQYAMPRPFELAAALNRLPSLRIK
jgi:predicted ABC-class ATPase